MFVSNDPYSVGGQGATYYPMSYHVGGIPVAEMPMNVGDGMFPGNLYSTSPQQQLQVQQAASAGMYTVSPGVQHPVGNSFFDTTGPEAAYGFVAPGTVGDLFSAPAPSPGGRCPRGGGGGGRGRGGGGRGGGGFGGGMRMGRGGGGAAVMPDEYEVHDNHLKAPVAVKPNEVLPTAGSLRLFGGPAQPIVYGSRNVFRICEAFQEGRCAAYDTCNDVHVLPDYLNATRQQMTAWLQGCEDEFSATNACDPSYTFRIFVTDLKEVVEVPIMALTFTKGLYVDPTTRARRTRAAHSHGGGGGQNAMAAQVPTGCGLFAANPNQCKWGRWCNQVHIDPQWMREKKEGFQHWFEKLESDFDAYPIDHEFVVHDPQLKMSVRLPKYSVANFTRGLFQGSNKKAPSVCLLFQKGRCTAGACCNQIHIMPQYLALVRAQGGDTAPGQSPGAHELEALRAALRAQYLQQHQPQPSLQQQQHMQVPVQGQQHNRNNSSYNLPLPIPVGPVGPVGPASMSPRVEIPRPHSGDEYSGALFEHIHVDEDSVDCGAIAVSSDSHSHETGGAGDCVAFNSSGTHTHMARHFNPDGSYTNNPYGSLTSLPEGSSSHSGRPTSVPVVLVGGQRAAPCGAAASVLYSRAAATAGSPQSKKACVQLPTHHTEPLLSAGANASSIANAPMPHFLVTAHQRGSSIYGFSTSTSLTQMGSGRSGSRGMNASRGGGGAMHFQHPGYRSSGHGPSMPMNRSHTGPEDLFTPQEFDTSLHFSPSPLMSANNSVTRHPPGDDEFGYTSPKMGGGPNASQGSYHHYNPNSSGANAQQRFGNSATGPRHNGSAKMADGVSHSSTHPAVASYTDNGAVTPSAVGTDGNQAQSQNEANSSSASQSAAARAKVHEKCTVHLQDADMPVTTEST